MVREMIAAGLVVIVAGCTQQAGEGGGKSWTDKATSAVSSREWKLSESNSGIDGKKVSATRAYSFAGQNAQFDVEIICQPSKKSTLGDLAAGDFGGTLHMNIKSFVGDVSNPSEASALISETNFVRQNDYSNPAELNYPVSRIRIGDNTYSGPMAAMVLRMGDYSNEAIYTGLLTLGESIPMTIELKNGAGTFELGVDRSSEVEQVLAACGQDAASLTKAEAEQERMAQEAKEEAVRQALLADRNSLVAEIGRSCRSFGDLTRFDMSEHEVVFNRLTPELKETVKLDCDESAPEELKAFQAHFESEFAVHVAYLTSGGNSRAMPACSARDFLAYVRSNGAGIQGSRSHSDDCEEWKRFGSDGPSVEELVSASTEGSGSMADFQADYKRARDAAIKDARSAINSTAVESTH